MPKRWWVFKQNLKKDTAGGKRYFHRRWSWTRVTKDEIEKFHFNLEMVVRKRIEDNWFQSQFEIRGPGNDPGWTGYLTLLGVSIYWSTTLFAKLAERLTRCEVYPYDGRLWRLYLSNGRLHWSIAEHDDSCRRIFGPLNKRRVLNGPGKLRRSERYPRWRRGSIMLNLVEAIYGPKRYSYRNLEWFVADLTFPDGVYPAKLTLQMVRFGRTKVDKAKHEVSYCIDVDSREGIPTHYDKSGGWKGDRTYGFGVNFPYTRTDGWKIDAEAAVMAWIYNNRARTGFREPLPKES